MAIQQSFALLCLANSSGVTSMTRPPTPVRSFPLCPSRIHSINDRPGFRATFLRSVPAPADILCCEAGAGNEGANRLFPLLPADKPAFLAAILERALLDRPLGLSVGEPEVLDLPQPRVSE